MAANQSILELMTSPFSSGSMKYCFSKVLLRGKLPDQIFFHNIRQHNFDSAAQAPCWSLWPAWGRSQIHVDIDYEKSFGLWAYLSKYSIVKDSNADWGVIFRFLKSSPITKAVCTKISIFALKYVLPKYHYTLVRWNGKMQMIDFEISKNFWGP